MPVFGGSICRGFHGDKHLPFPCFITSLLWATRSLAFSSSQSPRNSETNKSPITLDKQRKCSLFENMLIEEKQIIHFRGLSQIRQRLYAKL